MCYMYVPVPISHCSHSNCEVKKSATKFYTGLPTWQLLYYLRSYLKVPYEVLPKKTQAYSRQWSFNGSDEIQA